MKMFSRVMMAMMVAGLMTAPLRAEESAEPKTIAETAIAAGQFETLVTAAKAAGLVEALSGDQKLTVFAPTDAAFAKLPKGTVETLLKPANKGQLKSILLYHVVKGSVPAAKVLQKDELKTLQGKMLNVKVSDAGAMVNQAKIVKTDIECSNGIIHVIDAVVLPPSDK